MTDPDERLRCLRAWLRTHDGLSACELTVASGDASFRRYFRARVDDKSFIVMDAPPDKEDCWPFVKVAALLREAGVHAPRILAQDLKQGFLLLTDLGMQTYLDVLTPENADALF
ncbi:MAG: phosphotransferase, partial [Gammaproteobacteria bacterium]|nr:phosphotransferase [Gammaproteobacteria bacterium]